MAAGADAIDSDQPNPGVGFPIGGPLPRPARKTGADNKEGKTSGQEPAAAVSGSLDGDTMHESCFERSAST
jgi:hypothetical protein